MIIINIILSIYLKLLLDNYYIKLISALNTGKYFVGGRDKTSLYIKS